MVGINVNGSEVFVSWRHQANNRMFEVAWTNISVLREIQLQASLDFQTDFCRGVNSPAQWNISLDTNYKPTVSGAAQMYQHDMLLRQSKRCTSLIPVGSESCSSRAHMMPHQSSCKIDLAEDTYYLIEVCPHLNESAHSLFKSNFSVLFKEAEKFEDI